MKSSKLLRSIVALCLTFALMLTLAGPLQTAAADGQYVSDVYVAYGKDAEAAKKTLTDKGYTPVDGNLNDGGKTYTMLGVKSTSDPQDAITDISVMNMRGGYSVDEYRAFLRSQKTKITDFLNEFMSVIREYRTNLKNNKQKAVVIRELLNNYVDDDTGMKMGDLLNSETLQDKMGVAKSIGAANPGKLPDLVTILLQGNAQVLNSVEFLLCMAADTADNSWIDRFAALDYDKLFDQIEDERPELNTETKRQQYADNLYGETADALSMEVAELRNKLLAYESADLKLETATEEDIKKTFGDVENDFNAAIRLQDWMSIGAIYDGLSAYEGGAFKKGELLRFFCEEVDPEDYEDRYYPMAAAFSEGQRCGMVFVNLENLLRCTFADEAGWKQIAGENTDYSGEETVSVYQNIDRDVYREDGSVALTDAAQRANAVGSGTTGSALSQLSTLSKITAITWAGCVATLASTIITRTFGNRGLMQVATIYQKHLSYCTVEHWFSCISDAATGYDAGLFRGWYKDIYKLDPAAAAKFKSAAFSMALSQLFVLTTIVLAVASTVLTIIDLCRDTSVEQLPIPKYLVDNRTEADGVSHTVNYRAAACNREEYFGKDYKRQKGACADLLADEGKQWLTLYVTKDKTYGAPVTTDVVVQSAKDAPGGFEGSVGIVGELGAVNIASTAFRDYSTVSALWQTVAGDKTIYVFYKTDRKALPAGEPENAEAQGFGSGAVTLIGIGGLAAGLILGAAGAFLISKKKKKEKVEA